jgi:hypothetical protein
MNGGQTVRWCAAFRNQPVCGASRPDYGTHTMRFVFRVEVRLTAGVGRILLGIAALLKLFM